MAVGDTTYKGETIHYKPEMVSGFGGGFRRYFYVQGRQFDSLASARAYVDSLQPAPTAQQTAVSNAQQNYYDRLAAGQQAQQDYATKIMDKAVTAGLEHQQFVEKRQQQLLDKYGSRLEELQQSPTGEEVGNLMAAGTAEIMRAQQNAMRTATAGLAARGLVGSSAMESAMAKVAGETAGKIGQLSATTQQTLLQTRAQQEIGVMNAMTNVLGIPALQGYQQLAQAGTLASGFAVPTAMPPTTTSF